MQRTKYLADRYGLPPLAWSIYGVRSSGPGGATRWRF